MRVDFAHQLYVLTSKNSWRLREAKRALFTAEYRLATPNPSAAAAKSRLAEAKAALNSAHLSNGNVNRVDKKYDESARTLASTWSKSTEAAVAAAEDWVAAAEAAESQAPQRSSNKLRR